MRDELASTANEPPARITAGLHAERHYSPSELAELWGLSSDTIRRLFEDEPGVVTIGERNPRRKRRYVTLRIPQSVAARVHRRLSPK
jgi:hypothetical protein